MQKSSPVEPASAWERHREMQQKARYYRFDPTTIRAATRLMRLSCLGRLPLRDLHAYLRLLAIMEPGGVEKAARRLGRTALRRASLGHTGVAPVFGLRHARRSANRQPHRVRAKVSRGAPILPEQVEHLLRGFQPEPARRTARALPGCP